MHRVFYCVHFMETRLYNSFILPGNCLNFWYLTLQSLVYSCCFLLFFKNLTISPSKKGNVTVYLEIFDVRDRSDGPMQHFCIVYCL